MAGEKPKLVNKQFNSPIGLYSEHNIREILDKETQLLENGAVGINFHNPMMTKPTNLHNSAVLRMLEEEEGQQWSRQGVKRVAWPPPRDAEDEYTEQTAVQAQGGAQYSSQKPGLQKSQSPNNLQQAPVTNNYQQARSATPQSPLLISSAFQPPVQAKTWAPVQSPSSPRQFQSSPQPYQQAPIQQLQQVPVQRSPTPQPVHTPLYQPVQTPQYQTQAVQPQTPQYKAQPQSPQYQAQPQSPQYQAQPQSPQLQSVQTPQQKSPTQQIQQPQYQAPQPKQVEPPPSTITLRAQVPTRQAPAPIVSSQPATATFRGGKNLRGDLKWPPEDVKERMEAEKKHIMDLSQGPACKPRKVRKDYSSFFAQHALNNSYPGYKVPPGTQYYEHQPMM